MAGTSLPGAPVFPELPSWALHLRDSKTPISAPSRKLAAGAVRTTVMGRMLWGALAVEHTGGFNLTSFTWEEQGLHHSELIRTLP